MCALHSGIDEVDDTIADWEASVGPGAFLGARRRNKRSCLAETAKKEINLPIASGFQRVSKVIHVCFHFALLCSLIG